MQTAGYLVVDIIHAPELTCSSLYPNRGVIAEKLSVKCLEWLDQRDRHKVFFSPLFRWFSQTSFWIYNRWVRDSFGRIFSGFFWRCLGDTKASFGSMFIAFLGWRSNVKMEKNPRCKRIIEVWKAGASPRLSALREAFGCLHGKYNSNVKFLSFEFRT